MQSFEYVAVKTIAEAVELLAAGEGERRVLAGGSDLIVQLREGRRSAEMLVDVKGIPELNRLEVTEEGLWIGAAAPCYRICDFLEARNLYPGLADAVALIGGTQIQGRASLGGNLCNASPAADSIPALIVHGAVCQICGPRGRREVQAEDFCSAPGRNVLERGELLCGLFIPAAPPGFGAAYLRFIPRNEMDIAVVGAGAALSLTEDGQSVKAARVALGAVAPVPLFVREAGEYLAGRSPGREEIEIAARIAQEAARQIDDIRGTAAQRSHLAYVLARCSLERALARASIQEAV